MTRLTRSEEETHALGAEMAVGLQPGSVVLLSGDLGAGKTAFVRGLASGLGIDPDEVSSPTFTLVHEYRGGRLVLYHADLYRLERVGTDDLGLDQIGADGVLAVEWPDRLTHELAGAIRVIIDIVDDETRRIVVGEGGATDVDGHSIR
jgi:tRNA threonylcarbamoyladenosine biosynthesis protein TsaE